jgi:hypothetical protein
MLTRQGQRLGELGVREGAVWSVFHGELGELNRPSTVAYCTRGNRAEQVAAVAVGGSRGESLCGVGGGSHVGIQTGASEGIEQRRVVGVLGKPRVQEDDRLGGTAQLDESDCALRDVLGRCDRHRSLCFFM